MIDSRPIDLTALLAIFAVTRPGQRRSMPLPAFPAAPQDADEQLRERFQQAMATPELEPKMTAQRLNLPPVQDINMRGRTSFLSMRPSPGGNRVPDAPRDASITTRSPTSTPEGRAQGFPDRALPHTDQQLPPPRNLERRPRDHTDAVSKLPFRDAVQEQLSAAQLGRWQLDPAEAQTTSAHSRSFTRDDAPTLDGRAHDIPAQAFPDADQQQPPPWNPETKVAPRAERHASSPPHALGAPRPEARNGHPVAGRSPLAKSTDDTDGHSRQHSHDLVEQVTPPMQTIPRLPAAPSAPESRHEALTRERLCEVVERLLVSDRRGPDPQVRMTLRDDFLPGVAVCVQQAAGQLVVAFECTARASQHRLDKSAVGIARTLAHRLRCDVVVRVRATDGDDESLPDREVFAGQDEASP